MSAVPTERLEHGRCPRTTPVGQWTKPLGKYLRKRSRCGTYASTVSLLAERAVRAPSTSWEAQGGQSHSGLPLRGRSGPPRVFAHSCQQLESLVVQSRDLRKDGADAEFRTGEAACGRQEQLPQPHHPLGPQPSPPTFQKPELNIWETSAQHF